MEKLTAGLRCYFRNFFNLWFRQSLDMSRTDVSHKFPTCDVNHKFLCGVNHKFLTCASSWRLKSTWKSTAGAAAVSRVSGIYSWPNKSPGWL